MWSKKALSQLDKWIAPAGPCAFCGFRDKRHRLFDAILDLNESDKATEVLYDWLPLEAIKAIRTIRPYRRGGKLLNG